jgi:hypothetical protein
MIMAALGGSTHLTDQAIALIKIIRKALLPTAHPLSSSGVHLGFLLDKIAIQDFSTIIISGEGQDCLKKVQENPSTNWAAMT